MHRLLERLDGAASTIVPLAYLCGLMIGTMAYFTGITLNLGLAVGLSLAVAAELHSFLEQRRVRALWATWARARRDLAARTQLQLHVAILGALVLFSAVNATAFIAETWTPAHGFLPDWLQIGIRGCVVPVLFLLACFLTPLHADAGDLLAVASHAMLHRAIKATTKQWRKRIRRAERSGHDLAPVAIALMQDAGDTDGARRISMIADGLSAAESGQRGQVIIQPAAARTSVAALTALPEGSGAPTLPTGPGTPAATPRPRQRHRSASGRAPAVIRLTPATRSVEDIARAAWRPGMTIGELQTAAGISRTAAAKYRRTFAAEQLDRNTAEQLDRGAQVAQ